MRDQHPVFQVVTTFKLVTKKVPRPVAERKKWKKFGRCENDGPGPQVATTYVAEEVLMQFVRNRYGEVGRLILLVFHCLCFLDFVQVYCAHRGFHLYLLVARSKVGFSVHNVFDF